ncbi:MAG: hypothetical protein Pyrs2KO_03090 [Pyruvatibacter sp.]
MTLPPFAFQAAELRIFAPIGGFAPGSQIVRQNDTVSVIPVRERPVVDKSLKLLTLLRSRNLTPPASSGIVMAWH